MQRIVDRDRGGRSRRRKSDRSTIREIAHEAGVSTATVSRVLNDPNRVAESTRTVVQEIVERRHYVMHGAAMSLSSNRTSTIGLIIPTITNSIYASSTQAIQQMAQRHGYTVLLGVSEFDPGEEAKLIRRLIERRVDGIIVTGGRRPEELYQLIEQNSVPYIVTWKLTDGPSRPCVSFDNYRAGRLAMEHLIGLGHRRIGLICGRTDLNDRAAERRRAYEDLLREKGIGLDMDLVYERDFEFIEGQTAMQRLLSEFDRPTAVFCANDIQAIGALTACREQAIKVPEEISIIGFDDLPVAQHTSPKLTTVHVPAKYMGHLAATRLITWIRTGQRPGTDELPVDIIVRESTAEPPEHKDFGTR
jgi:LacI family transcriptional regulator